MQKFKKLDDLKAMADVLAKGWPWIVSVIKAGQEIMLSKHRTQQAAAGYAARWHGRVVDLEDHVKELQVAPLVAAFTSGQKEWVDDWSDRLEKMDEAEAETVVEAEEQAQVYQAALLAFGDAVIDCEVGNVQIAFDDLLSAASGNPSGQDVIRQAKEVLAEGVKFALAQNNQTIFVRFDNRIAVENLVVGVDTYGDTEEPSVWFSVLVDGKEVVRTLEWLDDNGDIVEVATRNNYLWPQEFKNVAKALGGADEDAVHEAIIERLTEALEQLPTPPEGPKDDEDFDEVFDEVFAEIFAMPEVEHSTAGNAPQALKQVPLCALPRELEDAAQTVMPLAFEVQGFRYTVLGSAELKEGTAHVLLRKDIGVAGVSVDFGSASWFDVSSVQAALAAWTSENEAAATEFDELEAA